MARRVKKKPRKEVGPYFRIAARTVLDQAKLCGWSLPRVKRELRGRFYRLRNRGSYSSWNRAVRKVFGVGIRKLPDLRQQKLFDA
jgi:hypothetical protein